MAEIKPKKVLAVNFGGLGDEILFYPTIKSLKEIYPDCSLTLALEPRSKSAKALNKDINEVICVDIKSKNKYINILKFLFTVWFKNFDVVFSSGSSKLVAILLFLTGIKERYGFYSGKLSKILLTQTVELNKKQYAANMYHDLVRAVRKEQQCSLPEINVELQKFEHEPYILIHPGVSLMSIKKNILKFWDEKRWAELIARLLQRGEKVILAGSKDDTPAIEKIVNNLEEAKIDLTNFTNYLGKTKNVKDLASLIKASKVTICVDSAPVHIAVATETNTVVIFGPTNDKILVPNSKKVKVAINNNSTCRPCLWEKRQVSCETCECLDVSVDDVYKNVEEFLS